MATIAPDISKAPSPPANFAPPAPPFGVNEMRLGPREWIAALAIVVVFMLIVPRAWKRFEPFPTGPDYRIPYALSKDYWLYQRRLEQIAGPRHIPILGDSVVWGEYVRPSGTLSHFLNQQTDQADRFVNCGVNGLFPLAMEGLVEDYGSTLRNRKIIVQCNLLWLSSPKADLSTTKEENFNHSRLVPQFRVRVPCYKADANERMSAVIERNVGYFAWVGHLENAYYDQRSIPRWTLEDNGNEPPEYVNAWRNPLAPLKSAIPAEPREDPDRGPASRRHKSWNAGGAEPTQFDWVNLNDSLQWQAFERVIRLLKARHNDVLVLLGPFNESMIAPDQGPVYRALRDAAAAKLARQGVALVVPKSLPSALYADASHPLTAGYALLAWRLKSDSTFQRWIAQNPQSP
jgi:hypothetical protein